MPKAILPFLKNVQKTLILAVLTVNKQGFTFIEHLLCDKQSSKCFIWKTLLNTKRLRSVLLSAFPFYIEETKVWGSPTAGKKGKLG